MTSSGPPDTSPNSGFELDRDTRLTRRPDGVFEGHLARGWDVFGVLNGGYLMALAVRAMAATLSHPDPLVVTGFFLEKARAEPVEIAVDVLRTGGMSSTAEASLTQGGRLRSRFIATFGDFDRAEGPTLVSSGPPSLPRPEDMPSLPHTGPPAARIASRFEIRADAELFGWMRGQTRDEAEIGGWIRLADGRPPDTMALTLLADAFPPAIYTQLGPVAWVPTLQLTVQVRRRPVAGWILAWFRTRYLTAGYLEEDGELWDAEGNLVAVSRQLARLVSRPSGVGPPSA